MTYSKQYRYRFGDIDDAGIAYYPKFFHYFHCAFEDWWSEELGIAYPTLMHDEDLGFPVVHVDADFFAPIRYGDEPFLHVGVLRVGGASVEFGFWMRIPGADPEIRCAARITTVAIAMKSGQKRALPDRWRSEFARFAVAPEDFPGKRRS